MPFEAAAFAAGNRFPNGDMFLNTVHSQQPAGGRESCAWLDDGRLNTVQISPGGERGHMKWETRSIADLTADEQSALRTLSLAVYPPEVASAWPGRAIEWAPHQWGVIGWDADGSALCYVGAILRDARWNDRAVRVGGIGGVKTHPASRGGGFATTAIEWTLDFFRGQGDVDFGLLVCDPDLVPFYERLGWRRFPGELLVKSAFSLLIIWRT
jgi:hypothetical protein